MIGTIIEKATDPANSRFAASFAGVVGVGATAGMAFDALISQLDTETSGTIVLCLGPAPAQDARASERLPVSPE